MLHPLFIRHRHKLVLQQWLLLMVMLLALAVAIGLAQWRAHQEIERAEHQHLLTQVRVADQLLSTQIRSADAALRTLLDGFWRWRGPQGYLPYAQEHLKRVEKMMPGTRTFAVIDVRGICQLSNRTELIGMDLSGRSYFSQAQKDPHSGVLHVAPPYRTVLGAWAVTISRAIINHQGQFDGVVVATLSPDYFETLMENLRYASDMRVSLLHDQGQAYVTSPPAPEALNKDFSGNSNNFSLQSLAGRTEVSLQGPGLDGRQRLGMARRVALTEFHATHGFVAVASRDIVAVYAPWRITNLVLFGLWLAVAGMLVWGLARYQKSAAVLRAQAETAEQALRDLAYHDSLTGAENRRRFLEKLQSELARVQRYDARTSLIMLDIDFFKNVNDQHGHNVGDAVLKHLVSVLLSQLRDVDSLGRLGGEEFAVLLPGTDQLAAVLLAERLRHAVEDTPACAGSVSVTLTISLGVAALDPAMTDVKDALKLADSAMYQAKRLGRNRVCRAENAHPMPANT
jgi:diguanylate cyclase (GGDEF)-like protein